MSGGICVVHLVRKANGTAPLRAFLESHAHHPPGLEYSLLLLFKGFARDDLSEYQELLADVPHLSMHVPDTGFDIGPYFAAVKAHDFSYFAFFNSFSLILANDWLAKLYAHASLPGAGAVGATGSWESISHMSADRYANRWWGRRLAARWRQMMMERYFPPFPNPHLRSNAFMASREVLMRIAVPPMLEKRDAHRFESGTRSLTRQILAMGRTVAVVGADGKAYAPEGWAASATFRGAGQRNLLVADNQTAIFAAAAAETRRRLARDAWGDGATHVA